MYRVKPRTPGQERRRQARIARRAEQRTGAVEMRTMPKPARMSPFQRLKFRRVNRERSERWTGFIARRIAEMWTRTSDVPRCPFARVYKERDQMVAGDHCGGKLKRTLTGNYRCQACGRDWTARSDRLEPATA
jgi:hypothetical protein